MKRLLFIVLILATPVFAVEPDEIMANPVLEARARDISKGLRCLVCRNENIDSSQAGIARDLRLLVRERLRTGDTDEQVVAYIVNLYGEFVLLKPPFNAGNMLLWLIGPITLIIGGAGTVVFIRRRPKHGQADLSESEQARLDQLLQE